LRLSIPTTSSPRSSKARAVAAPMNPATPVTNTVMGRAIGAGPSGWKWN